MKRKHVFLLKQRLLYDNYCRLFGKNHHKRISVEEILTVMEKSEGKFFFDDKGKTEIAFALKKYYGEENEKTLAKADNIMNHRFQFLGSKSVYLGNPINWFIDIKSGYQWKKNLFYNNLKLNADKGDIKAMWELSRFYHIIPLGKAYLLSGDEKYAGEGIAQIEDWVQANPCPFSPIWASTIDSAIRMVNWIWFFFLIKHSPSATEVFKIFFYRSLLEHAIHIENTMDESVAPHNHFLISFSALIYFYLLFGQGTCDQNRLQVFIERFQNQTEFQFYKDGVNFENSIAYHRFVVEMILGIYVLLKKNRISILENKKDLIEKMLFYVNVYMNENREAPVVGDNGNDRFLVLNEAKLLNHRYLSDLGVALFGGSKPCKRDIPAQDVLWYLGEEGYRKYKNAPEIGGQEVFHYFPDSKNAVFKDNLFYCFVQGADSGRHGHGDTLSFCLSKKGEDFIIDRGSPVYLGDVKKRLEYRGSRSHNMVVVNGENTAKLKGCWNISDAVQTKVLSKNAHAIEYEHNGYEGIGIVCGRSFRRKNTGFEVTDFLNGGSTPDLEYLLHFPDLRVELTEDKEDVEWKIKVEVFGKKERLTIKISFPPKEYICKISESYFSMSYGEEQKGKALSIFFHQAPLPFKIKTLFL